MITPFALSRPFVGILPVIVSIFVGEIGTVV